MVSLRGLVHDALALVAVLLLLPAIVVWALYAALRHDPDEPPDPDGGWWG